MSKRLTWLDALRGLTVISMIFYHGTWNAVYLYNASLPWYEGLPGYLWQQSICWTFILVAGFCAQIGRHRLKRGLLISACGLLVTVVTTLYSPVTKILFGVLTFHGAAVLLSVPLEKPLKKIPPAVGLAASALLFFLTRNVGSGRWGFEGLTLGRVPAAFYRNNLTAFLGFPGPGFYSADYFPIIPWFFLFLCGFFLYGLLQKKAGNEPIASLPAIRRLEARPAPKVLQFVGRHALIIYLLHQPILELFFTLINMG